MCDFSEKTNVVLDGGSLPKMKILEVKIIRCNFCHELIEPYIESCGPLGPLVYLYNDPIKDRPKGAD